MDSRKRRRVSLLAPGEEPNTWDVAWLAAKAGRPVNGSMGGETEHRGLSLEMACSWAEEVVEEFGGALILADRRKAWRRSRDISEAQKRMAARCGIEVTEDMRKGELSDLIDVVVASRRIDPLIAMLEVSRG